MLTPLLLLLSLPLMPSKAEEPKIVCPGLTTYEMRFCASQKWEESNQALKEQLTPATLKKWKAAPGRSVPLLMPHTDKGRSIPRWLSDAMTD